ncbi:MAG TPA: hypothetical protein LFW20_02380 [Rickettsia endosymbiont of Omalisus fontisbellaquei]|nr:hypothetical protein [Rickettsia endosymbiont of Omalisus fontisbellaquei]
MTTWHKFESTSNNKKFQKKSENERLQNIESKVGNISGRVIAMQSSIDNRFQELHMQNQRHLNMMQNKAEFHFVVMIILNYLLSVKQLSFLISLVSDQNILKFLNSLL